MAQLDVKLNKLYNEDSQSKTRAYADVTIDNMLTINGIRVVEGQKKDTGEKYNFVSMPSAKDKDGNFRDIAHSIDSQTSKDIIKAIMDEYNKEDIIKDISVKVYPLENSENSTKAMASVNVNNLVAINGLRVIEGQHGPFVAYPQTQVGEKDGKPVYRDVATIDSAELKSAINRATLREYKNITKDAINKEAEKKQPEQDKKPPTKPSQDER